MKWQRKKFSDLYAVPSRNGLNRPSRVRGEGYKMVNMGELFANDRIGNIPMDRVQMNDKEIENCSLVEGDLLFARQSLVLEGAGKCSYVLEVPETTTFESHLIRVRLDKAKADPLFYYYLFSSPFSGMSTIVQQCAQAGIRGSELGNLEVLYPNPEQQSEIARLLGKFDDQIENNRRRMELLEKAARLLYQEWFVRLRFPGHEHTRITKGMPEGWANKYITELANVTMGQSPESQFYNQEGDGLPFHQGVADFGDRFVTHRVFTTALNRIAEAGDILCSVRAPVGRLNYTLDKIVIGRGLSAFRSKQNTQSFLFYQLAKHFFKEDLIGAGAIFASVTKDELLSQALLTPPHKLIQAFEEISGPIDEQIKVLFQQNQKLRAARDILLPRAMSGETIL